jgi:hypothetical protein
MATRSKSVQDLTDAYIDGILVCSHALTKMSREQVLMSQNSIERVNRAIELTRQKISRSRDAASRSDFALEQWLAITGQRHSDPHAESK